MWLVTTTLSSVICSLHRHSSFQLGIFLLQTNLRNWGYRWLIGFWFAKLHNIIFILIIFILMTVINLTGSICEFCESIDVPLKWPQAIVSFSVKKKNYYNFKIQKEYRPGLFMQFTLKAAKEKWSTLKFNDQIKSDKMTNLNNL